MRPGGAQVFRKVSGPVQFGPEVRSDSFHRNSVGLPRVINYPDIGATQSRVHLEPESSWRWLHQGNERNGELKNYDGRHGNAPPSTRCQPRERHVPKPRLAGWPKPWCPVGDCMRTADIVRHGSALGNELRVAIPTSCKAAVNTAAAQSGGGHTSPLFGRHVSGE